MLENREKSFAFPVRICIDKFLKAYNKHCYDGNMIQASIGVTQRNVIGELNSIEDLLKGLYQFQPITVDRFLSTITQINFVSRMLIFSSATDTTPLTSEAFKDGRTVPEGYTIASYVEEKLPSVKEIWSSINEIATQDSPIRTKIIELAQAKIDQLGAQISTQTDERTSKFFEEERSIYQDLLQQVQQCYSVRPSKSLITRRLQP